MEMQSSTRLGALEKLKSFRGIEKQRSFKFLSMEKQQSLERRNKDSSGKRGDTELHLAARAGRLPMFRRSLPRSAGIKANNSFDAFHIAAKQGHLDVLKELLQAFPSLAMTTNSVNATALDTAATQGHIGIVNLLLETDASLARIARNNGKTVLHSAARMGHVEVVTSLLNKDPGIGFRTDKKGQTALHMASKDNKGNRPLHVATRKGNTISRLISVEGVEINAINRAGETAFAIAQKLGNEELSNILREAGGETAKEQVNPPNSAKQLKKTVSDIRHDVQSQIKQTHQTKMHFHKIKKRIQKLHIGGLNNAINSNTIVAVLIATVAFAAIFTIPVVVVQTSLIVVEQKAKKKMVFVMNKLMWLACLCISSAFIALTYVVVGHDDRVASLVYNGIGTVIMLATLGSMCYCIIAHRMQEKNMKRIKRSSTSQSWSISVDSDTELLNNEYKKIYAL
ncbi:hypothetical protein GUJ93_ZPchr0676g2753 [Zizania palustris]|uniref:PGG domain-containing protein n=1 Tax=Zizania palustris TaxID=103762 RepID=A0A8J5VD71_ZIZPA|nr:hypothetical protein GUJ93_ZPchr0676g2753 [Zizania palustris]